MRPDRVVLFHDFSEALGGASHLVQVLIRELRSLGLPVTFIAGDAGRNFHRDDVEFLAVGDSALLEKGRLAAATSGLFNRRGHDITRDWIARNDTPGTVYHLHGWCKVLSPSIFAALAPVKERVVLHAHDYFLCCPNGGYFDFQKGESCGRVPLSADCLSTQCDKAGWGQKGWRVAREGLRRTLDRRGGNAARILMIHPGMAPHLARGGRKPELLHAVRNPAEPWCRERVRAEDNHEILFVGRISAEKGADLAAAAADRAGLPITFVGEGAEAATLAARYPNARMLGWRSREELREIAGRARLAVMPSRWSEPFGLVALEAAGSGLPVVCAARALIAPELVQEGFGTAVEPDDIDAFARHLTALAGDDAAVERMSRAGYEGFRRLCHSEESWASEIVAHYEAVLDEATSQVQHFSLPNAAGALRITPQDRG
jgi:glycosyltransferase involved in cell wall biosynthesis